MKVLVVGAGGNLGVQLVRTFAEAGHDVTSVDRSLLDVTDARAVRDTVAGGRFSAIVNAAAWNDVDGAEKPENRAAVFALNADAPAYLAAAAKDAGAAFVHVSTDYVFAGDRPEGYAERDEPRPISVYGESKYEGERRAAAAGGDVYVCRTSKLFGPPGTSAAAKPGFLNVMLALAAAKPELSIVDEEVGSPTYTADLAGGILALLKERREPGTYHLINGGAGATWYGFAEEFFGLLGVTTPRNAVSSAQFPKPARRPAFAPLVSTKIPSLRPRVEALQAFFAAHPECIPPQFRPAAALVR